MRLLGTLVVAAIVTLACGPASDVVAMPPGLVGTWTTDDARYEERFFELTQTTLVIGIEDAEPARYPVSALHLTQDERGRPLYRLDYVDGETIYSMAFHFSAAESGGRLSMKNQPTIVWKKSRG